MNDDLAIRGDELDALNKLGEALLKSGFFPDVTSVARAAIKVLAGRELGLGPVESMRSLHIIEGKIEMSADLLAQRVKAHPKYDYRVAKITNDMCSIEFLQRHPLGAPESIGLSTFTIDDARTAGLLDGASQTWRKWPRNMLFSRAISNGVAWFTPDVAGGGRIYVDGEISGSDSGTLNIGSADESPAAPGADKPFGVRAADSELTSGSESNAAAIGADTPIASEPDTSPSVDAEPDSAGGDLTSAGGEDGTAALRKGLPEPSPADDKPAAKPPCDDEWQEWFPDPNNGRKRDLIKGYVYCPKCRRTMKKSEVGIAS